MAILGFSINISRSLSTEQATTFAQWIGGANVVRNQKVIEYKSFLKAQTPELIAQGYAHIKSKPELSFLKPIPVQILRNAASAVFSDSNAAKSGLRKSPKVKNKFKKRSIILTKELFVVEPFFGKSRVHIKEHAKKGAKYLFSIVLPYEHQSLSKQFRVSRIGRKFTFSGCYDDGQPVIDPIETLEDYAHLPSDELVNYITGVDRGVALHLCSSEGFSATWSKEENETRRKRDAKIRHYQKLLARKKRKAGNKTKRCESNRQRKLQSRISKLKRQDTNFRTNKNHHTSKLFVAQAKPIIALEDLQLKNMTKRAKPKPNENGIGYARNNARAKSGLNRSMLDVALGQLATFIHYKALHLGKVTIKEIPPMNTSKRCNACGSMNTHREKQAGFECYDCGNKDNADHNAAKNIRDDAVIYIQERKFAKSKTRKITVRRKKKPVGNESPSLKNEQGSHVSPENVLALA